MSDYKIISLHITCLTMDNYKNKMTLVSDNAHALMLQ